MYLYVRGPRTRTNEAEQRREAHREAGRQTERGAVSVSEQHAHGHVRGVRTDVRFLYAFGLDVPAGEVVLQHADEALFGVVACFGTEYFIL